MNEIYLAATISVSFFSAPELLLDFAKLDSNANTKAIISGVAIFFIGYGLVIKIHHQTLRKWSDRH